MRTRGEDIVVQCGQLCMKKWKRGVVVAFAKPACTVAFLIWVIG